MILLPSELTGYRVAGRVVAAVMADRGARARARSQRTEAVTVFRFNENGRRATSHEKVSKNPEQQASSQMDTPHPLCRVSTIEPQPTISRASSKDKGLHKR